jgi:hypothetical protein
MCLPRADAQDRCRRLPCVFRTRPQRGPLCAATRFHSSSEIPICASAIWRKGSLDISTLQKPDTSTLRVQVLLPLIRNDRGPSPLEMSVYPRSRRAVGMWESPPFGDFQGLWEEGEGGQSHRPAFPSFHQAGISTALFLANCWLSAFAIWQH